VPDFSQHEGQRITSAGVVTASSRGTALTAGTANVKGSYAELVASTAHDAAWLIVHIAVNAGSHDALVDIAVGAAASEQVIIENIPIGIGSSSAKHPTIALFPIAVPAGTRIAARAQSTLASTVIYVHVQLCHGGFLASAPLSLVTTYGAATADSGGTQVDPGASANTKGSWVELTASSTYPIAALLVGVPNQNNATRSTGLYLLDIGIGGAGSEEVIVPDIQLHANAANDVIEPQLAGPFFVSIPAGTRIAARAQASITDATDRLFDCIVYGVS
jgi:hypothetical protein